MQQQQQAAAEAEGALDPLEAAQLLYSLADGQRAAALAEPIGEGVNSIEVA